MRWLLLLLASAAACSDVCRGGSGCALNACGEATCVCSGNGALTSEGVCQCDYGFTGTNCTLAIVVASATCRNGSYLALPEWRDTPQKCALGYCAPGFRELYRTNASGSSLFPPARSGCYPLTLGPLFLVPDANPTITGGRTLNNTQRFTSVPYLLGQPWILKAVPYQREVFTIHAATAPTRTLEVSLQHHVQLSKHELGIPTWWNVHQRSTGRHEITWFHDPGLYLNISATEGYGLSPLNATLRTILHPGLFSRLSASVDDPHQYVGIAYEECASLAARMGYRCFDWYNAGTCDLGDACTPAAPSDEITGVLNDTYLYRTDMEDVNLGFRVCNTTALCPGSGGLDNETLFTIRFISPGGNEVEILTRDKTRRVIGDYYTRLARLSAVAATREPVQSFYMQTSKFPKVQFFHTDDAGRFSALALLGGSYQRLQLIPATTSLPVISSTFNLTTVQCRSSPCQAGGTCVDGYDSFVCICPTGSSGTRCQTQINECASQPCANGGTCLDLVNGFSCACPAGYSGIRCQTNINECGSTPCRNGGTCADSVNGWLCLCLPGVVGGLCQTDVDECASLPCQNGATCIEI